MTEKLVFFLIFFMVTTFHVVLFNIKINKESPKDKNPKESKISITLLSPTVKTQKIETKKAETHSRASQPVKTVKPIKTKKIEMHSRASQPVKTVKPVKTKKIEMHSRASQQASQPVKTVKTYDHTSLLMAEKKYLTYIKKIIQDNIKYPRRARRLKKQGIVYISMVIKKDGKITKINVEKSSGSRILDKAAIKTIKNINKFNNIPEELKKNSWNIKIPMVYKLR